MKTLPATISRGSVLGFEFSVNPFPPPRRGRAREGVLYFSFISFSMMKPSRRGFQSSFELTP